MAQNPDMDGTKETDSSEQDPADSPSRENAEMDSPGEDDSAKITLSKKQLDDAGLSDLEEGDSFMVTLHGTVTDKGDDNGIDADVDELSDGRIEGITVDEKPPMPLRPGPTVKGPAAAGMLTPSSPMLPTDTQ